MGRPLAFFTALTLFCAAPALATCFDLSALIAQLPKQDSAHLNHPEIAHSKALIENQRAKVKDTVSSGYWTDGRFMIHRALGFNIFPELGPARAPSYAEHLANFERLVHALKLQPHQYLTPKILALSPKGEPVFVELGTTLGVNKIASRSAYNYNNAEVAHSAARGIWVLGDPTFNRDLATTPTLLIHDHLHEIAFLEDPHYAEAFIEGSKKLDEKNALRVGEHVNAVNARYTWALEQLVVLRPGADLGKLQLPWAVDDSVIYTVDALRNQLGQMKPETVRELGHRILKELPTLVDAKGGRVIDDITFHRRENFGGRVVWDKDDFIVAWADLEKAMQPGEQVEIQSAAMSEVLAYLLEVRKYSAARLTKDALRLDLNEHYEFENSSFSRLLSDTGFMEKGAFSNRFIY